jgi:GT2 family glycosyltransferase
VTVRVGLLGTFEVDNYGDLLFPLVAQTELARRRPDVDFVWLGPVGGSGDRWPTVVGLGPLCRERAERISEVCDAVVLGGGDLIRNSEVAVAPSYGMTERDAEIWKPSGWFSSMGLLADLGVIVAWNALGVAEQVESDVTEGAEYVSVRDQTSASNLGGGRALVVPDSVFLLDRLASQAELTAIHERLCEQYDLPAGDFIVLQASSSVAERLDFDAIGRAAGDRAVVVVQIGPCHGDGVTVDLARRHLGDRVRMLPVPTTLEAIAAVISRASAFLGNSLHGGITSLLYDVPFLLFQFDPYSKRRGVLEIAGVREDRLVTDPASVSASRLQRAVEWDRAGVVSMLEWHFDRIADLLPHTGASEPLAWEDRPELLQLALERQPPNRLLGTDLPVLPDEPPALPERLGSMISALLGATSKRAELPDPALPLLSELGRTRSTGDDFAEAVIQVRSLKTVLVEAQAGWSQAVGEVHSLEGALESTRGRVQSVESQLAYGEQRADGLERQLVERADCWLSSVTGPRVTGDGLAPDYSGQYRRWMADRSRYPGATMPSTDAPTFSILTPVFDPPARLLEDCIRSVRAQTYPNWELILLDVSEASHVAPICRRFSEIDDRVRTVASPNSGISANTNLAAGHAIGDWFVLLDHDDELASHALEAIARTIEDHPGASFMYSDEDKVDESGRRSDPFFKPDWSPDLLRTVNYVTHLQVVRRDLWERIGGLRPEFDGAQDYDLALRASWEAGGAVHIPDVLYHWRVHDESTAGDVGVKPYAHRAGRRSLEDFVRAHIAGAVVEFGPGPTSHRVRYPVRAQPLTVIIPFRDRWELTEACLTGIARTGTALPLEVLLVDNQSSDPVTLGKCDEWQDRFEWIRVLRHDEPFNFQKLNNLAVSHSRGELLLFLNNDVEPIHEGWVESMAEHAQRPEVGAVGARLFYPDGLVQHAGVFVGIGGYADHPWARLHPDTWTPAGPSYWTRNFLAVTAACLMVERAKFDQVGGFDERFTVGGGDVALGLALHEAGYWNVMTPFARLVHHESVSRGNVVPEDDLRVSEELYGPYLRSGDPFANPNLSLTDTSCSIECRTSP